MLRIAYYISDYGYGHAARSIAIIRNIRSNIYDCKIFVMNSFASEFISSSFKNDKCIEIRKIQNDVGFIVKSDFTIDKSKTKEMLNKWIKTWPFYLNKEIEFCKKNNIDVIISDIPPQVFLLGDMLNIPTIGITNFTWSEIYEYWFGKNKIVSEIVNAYAHSTKGLILPMESGNTDLHNTRKIGLVFRNITRKREIIRRDLGLKEDDFLIYLGLGKSLVEECVFNNNNNFDENIYTIVSSGSIVSSHADFEIPYNETESQDYVAASDLVITKFGYSTLSESLSQKIPVLLMLRDCLEDKKAMIILMKTGLIKKIDHLTFFSKNWKLKSNHMYQDLISNKISFSKRLASSGKEDILETLLNYYK